MSNTEATPDEITCPSAQAPGAEIELLDPVPVALGGPRGMPVLRTLPHRHRRMVGAWCFLDAYGPVALGEGTPGMQVAPHPHTGLQTVSWLVQGEILHRDSLGSVQLVEPGQLNLMTAGRGISHSEQTPPEHGPLLHGVQLWVALPDGSRGTEPAFEHRADLPRLILSGVGDSAAEVVVILGEVAGHASRASVHSPLVAAEVSVRGTVDLPLSPEFEHALLVLDGEVEVSAGAHGAEAATALAPGPLLYLGGSRPGVRVRSAPGQVARLLLIGGTPLGEELVMWWNFVGRSHEEIVTAREDWQAGRGFGEVGGYPGERLPAPALPGVRLRPRPAVRPPSS